MRTALSRRFSSFRQTARTSAMNRLGRLESLETRLTPAAIAWVGLAAIPSFEDPANWAPAFVPGAGDVAVIGAGFSAETITTSGSHTLDGISCAATLFVSGGTFSVSGATMSTVAHLIISGATVPLTPNLTSPDIQVLSGGVLDVPLAHDLINLSLNTNGAVTGAGDVTVTGTFATKGGVGTGGVSLHGGGKFILAAGAVGNVQGGVVLGRVFENHGTIAGDPSVGNMYWYLGPTATEPGIINNLAGATITADGDGVFLNIPAGGATNAINNFGTFTHNAGIYAGLNTSINVPFNNVGTVNNTGNILTFFNASSSGATNVTGGTVKFNGASDDSGPISISSGAVVEVTNSSTFTCNAGASVTGAGTFRVSTGTLNVAANTKAVNVELITNAANQLTGAGDLTVSGNLTWKGGSLRSGGKLILGAGGTGALSGILTIGRMFENHGTVTVADTLFDRAIHFGATAGEPGSINNVAGATFTLGNGYRLIPDFSGAHSISNAGTFAFTGAYVSSFVTTSIIIPFDNSGALTFSATTETPVQNFALTNSGTVTAASATFRLRNDYVQTSGTTTVLGALIATGIIDIKGGTLRGNGFVLTKTTNAGTVSPGTSPGILTIYGNYSQTGALDVELNGTTPGTLYDQLAVNGTVTLGGSLTGSVGYAPAAGTSFVIIANDGTDAVVGTFAGLAEGAITTIGGKSFAISYKGGTGNDVTLTRVVTPPTKVSSVVINGGDAQRSRVLSVAMTFDQHLTISFSLADAFAVTRQGDGKQPNLATTVDDSGATTVVTLTFIGSNAVEYGSLADGRYTLTIDASKVSNANGNLDGDGNGVGGDNYTLVGSPAESHHLFRLFGDADGDGTVAASDFIAFRLAFGGTSSTFDFDGDGAVAASDFIQFRLRFGGSI